MWWLSFMFQVRAPLPFLLVTWVKMHFCWKQTNKPTNLYNYLTKFSATQPFIIDTKTSEVKARFKYVSQSDSNAYTIKVNLTLSSAQYDFFAVVTKLGKGDQVSKQVPICKYFKFSLCMQWNYSDDHWTLLLLFNLLPIYYPSFMTMVKVQKRNSRELFWKKVAITTVLSHSNLARLKPAVTLQVKHSLLSHVWQTVTNVLVAVHLGLQTGVAQSTRPTTMDDWLAAFSLAGHKLCSPFLCNINLNILEGNRFQTLGQRMTLKAKTTATAFSLL